MCVRSPPSHHQRAPSPFLLDSSNFTDTPVHPLITSQLVSITVDYLCTSLPSLWLARSPALVYVLVYVVHHLHCVAVCVVPFLNIVLPVGLLFIKKRSLPALGLRSLFSTASSLYCDNVCNVLCISWLSVQYNDQKIHLVFLFN